MHESLQNRLPCYLINYESIFNTSSRSHDYFARLHVCHIGEPMRMVNCCIVGCNNHWDRGPAFCRNLCLKRDGEHNVSFYRIPAIICDRSTSVIKVATIKKNTTTFCSKERWLSSSNFQKGLGYE